MKPLDDYEAQLRATSPLPYVIAGALALVVTVALLTLWGDCDSRGGVLVEGVLFPQCVERLR